MSLLRKKTETKRSRHTVKETGNQNIPSYSYHNARNEQEDGIARDTNRQLAMRSMKSKSFWLNRFGFIILLVAIVVCLYNVLGLSTNPSVVFVGNSSDNLLYKLYEPAFVVSSKAQFKSSILNHNKITVDTNKITGQLSAEFPEFSQISITLPLVSHRPIIYIVPATPSLVLSNTQGVFVLNQSGDAILYGNSNSSFNYLNLPLVDDQSGLHLSVGKPALTSQDVAFIETVDTQLAAKGIKVSSMALPPSTSELDVHIAGKPYYVKFNLQNNDPKIQAGSFLASQNYLNSQSITPSQYIDVRTDGRVYYQ
jgi:hypothetical protein